MYRHRLTSFYRMGRFNKGESMKAFIFLSIVLSTHMHAQAVGGGLQTPDKEIIISDRTHRLEVALNPATVLCLTGDYGARSF